MCSLRSSSADVFDPGDPDAHVQRKAGGACARLSATGACERSEQAHGGPGPTPPCSDTLKVFQRVISGRDTGLDVIVSYMLDASDTWDV